MFAKGKLEEWFSEAMVRAAVDELKIRLWLRLLKKGPQKWLLGGSGSGSGSGFPNTALNTEKTQKNGYINSEKTQISEVSDTWLRGLVNIQKIHFTTTH